MIWVNYSEVMTLQEVVYKRNSRLGKFWLVSVIHPDMIQSSKGK